ncbi:MAG: biotin-dependent carboxyltransferase family protein [Lachnospiraceae bacterium]|nr:biotin-dependent carboxyltransferase family protein [Lachnospiraceae bacterium]
MAIRIIHPGALTTVQDLGRYGYQALGMPCSGVMDRQAYEAASYLVGNESGEAVLECTLFGGIYQFEDDAVCALTGADMQPTLDGTAVPMYRPFPVAKGQTLMLGTAVTGCRTTLAVAGGIDVPVVMGSRSTNLKCALGGYMGRALTAGDVLPVGASEVSVEDFITETAAAAEQKNASIAPSAAAEQVNSSIVSSSGIKTNDISSRKMEAPKYPEDLGIRVILGPQDDYFTESGLETFFSGTFTVSQESDRMGCRLNGPAIESKNGTDIISDAIVFGSIQVTPAGMPIILLADRQTTGGYAKIATVCSDDLPKLAQARPGYRIRFIKMI